MGMNKYSSVPTQPIIDSFIGMPFDAMLKAGTMKQGQFDKGKQATSMLEDAFLKVNALPVDEQKKNELIQGYRDKIKQKVQETKGDYSQLLPFTMDLSNEIKYELSQGALGAIQKSHDTYQTDRKRFAELSEKKSFLGQDEIAEYNMLGKSLKEYDAKGGIGEKTPVGYNTYKSGTVGPYYDVTEDMGKFWQQMQADQTSWVKDDKTGDFYYKGTTRKVDKNEVKNGVINLALKDPKYKGQFKDYIEYYDAVGGEGYGKQALGDYLMGLGDAVGNREGFTATTLDKDANLFALQNAKDKLDNPLTNLNINVPAGLYGGVTTKDGKILNKAIQNQTGQLGTEMAKLFPQKDADTYQKWFEDKLASDPKLTASDLVLQLKQSGNIKDPNALTKLQYLADQTDGLRQRNKEADDFVMKQFGMTPELMNSYNLMLTKTLTDELSEHQAYSNGISKADFVKLKKYHEDHKSQDTKNKYLENTAEQFTKNQFAATMFNVYTKDDAGNTIVDEKATRDLTKQVHAIFKDPQMLGNLAGYELTEEGYDEKAPIKMNSMLNKDSQISAPVITLGPGHSGSKEIRVNIDGKHYIVPVSNFANTFNLPQMNTLDDKVNTMLWNASTSGLREKKTPYGTIKFPIVPSDPSQQGTYQFYNDSEFIFTLPDGTQSSGNEAYEDIKALMGANAF